MSDYRVVSYGAEHEWADHPLSRALPADFGRDKNDITIVNSNGIANDPKGETYGFGGEFNTPPTSTIEGQLDCLQLLKDHYPEASINYRSNLHLHVHVPGLKNDLSMLKQLQLHIHTHLPEVLANVVEPIPMPLSSEYPTAEDYQGALRRLRRRRVSHQTFLTQKRLEYQLQAPTLDEFWKREAPQSKGKPMFHLQPRVCVNLRQLLQTDTIEFRHFPGTMDKEELRTAFRWVDLYMEHALDNLTIRSLTEAAEGWEFPWFLPYHHELESRYRRTVHDGTLDKQQIHAACLEIATENDLMQWQSNMIEEGYAIGACQ